MYIGQCDGVSICVRACDGRIVCQSKTDRCTRRDPSGGVRTAADISRSCSVFQGWRRSFSANDASNSGSAWPPLWESLRPCTPSRSRSNCP